MSDEHRALRAVIVAAVSSAEQATEEKDSIPGQLTACRQTCKRRGWNILAEIAIPGHSRNYNWLHEIIRDCEGYGQWVQLVESDIVDLVICRDYDRLWRTDALRAQVTALCREHRVQVFSLNQPVEPVQPGLLASGSDSHLVMEAMSGIISEMENRTRTRRMVAGKRARITKRGLPNYSNNTPYAYRRVGDGKYELVPEEAHWLRWIFDRRADDHWGYKHIAWVLTERGVQVPSLAPHRQQGIESRSGDWHAATVRGILRNPFYIGHVFWGGAYNENGKHPHAIPDELFEAAQRVTRQHSVYQKRGRSRPDHPLTGLARCAFCGHAMVYVPTKQGYAIRCAHYLSTRGTECMSNWQRVEPIHAFILATVKRIVQDPDAFLEYRNSQGDDDTTQTRIDGIDGLLEALQHRWERWNQAFEIGGISLAEMLEHRQRISQKTDALQDDREELAALQESGKTIMAGLQELQQVVGLLDDLTDRELNRVYLCLISRVLIARDQDPIIVWR